MTWNSFSTHSRFLVKVLFAYDFALLRLFSYSYVFAVAVCFWKFNHIINIRFKDIVCTYIRWPWLPYFGNENGCCSVDRNEYRTTIESVWQVKLVSTKLIFRAWAHNGTPDILLKVQTVRFYLEMFSINFRDLVEIGRAVFEKVAMICFVAALKGLYLGSWNGHIHRAPTCDA